MTKSIETIAVIGAGAWGTALAMVMARAGRGVILLARDAEAAAQIQKTRRNEKYLPGLDLPSAIQCESGFDAITRADAAVIATPAQHLRAACTAIKSAVQNKPIIITAKGIELQSDKLMIDVAGEYFPARQLEILSGPSFAADVAAGSPTAITLACQDQSLGEYLAAAMASNSLRPYWTSDVRGVCFGGALKNVIAIAAGIVIARGMGENSRAALITRGMREIVQMAAAHGGDPKTLMGLSGMGDLMLTCYSDQSRNFRFGMLLGQSQSAIEAQKKLSSTVEGVSTARAISDFAQKNKIEMPICSMVDAVIAQKLSIDQAIGLLMQRPLREE